ncbi:hypothetical protein N5079_26125 [Planotetraspora sp. A-T 1434]|uniref:hypothetical protein n=1 Tax=Planotetraspora sp. A-T 1434 TaxID=2979219 RepID=UPI0021BEB548|nr:hypothetical protein [Planotetraspora sp. A-T 1434]MCT9933697.1 hypothetical protein [Planotetraspora sp. A-T 1434]
MAGPGRLRRVLLPDFSLRNTWVRSPDQDGYGMLTSSRADFLRLGALVRLAADSPHSAVFIPCGANSVPHPMWWFNHQPPMDLVIVRHDVGLPPSAWKAVRMRCRRQTAEIRTMTTAPAVTTGEPEQWEWSHERLLCLTTYANTLVVAAPAWSLRHLAGMLTDAGELIASDRDIHRYGEAALTTLTYVIRDGGGVPGGNEFDIYGRDPIFHKSHWERRQGV